MNIKTVFVTGGAGYIGSHTILELLENDYDVIVADNLCNSSEESLRRVEDISKRKVKFYREDLRDKNAIDAIFKDNSIDAVIHFAGLKAVGESVEIPLSYYDNNIYGTLVLADVMKSNNVKKLVFSSSATVYGSPHTLPIKEDFPVSATNPYGRSKLIIEEILSDLYVSDNTWDITLLRYFNPVGAHISGRIGEDPNGIPNNLMPYISQVAVGKLNELSVFGDDYDTKDGTGVRDYIHVVDLAKGHLKALENIAGLNTYNLGTGTGYSVIEMVKAFQKASGKDVPYKIAPRRTGDIAACYADPSKAKDELGWVAEKDLDDMTKDTWRWQSNNPEGFKQ